MSLPRRRSVVKLWPSAIEFKEQTFRLLSGTEDMHALVKSGLAPDELLQRYEPELAAFRARRARYLLYPDRA